ncbi:hemolysin III family protein [Ascidiaceihabitans sp.]|nr:hemolysin III family protein [Ascidiaceihabitans sp.]
MYPTSRNETIADGIVHALSISLGLYGAVWLWCYLPMWRSTEMSWAVGVYIVIMVSAFTVSGVYHMTPISDLRLRLRRADHGLIFLRIASSYTPLVLVINTPFSYVVLAGVWIAALIGFFSKLVFWKGEGGSSLALYFALSCAMFLLIWPMWQRLYHTSIWLLLGGGATYGIGAIFYSRKTMPYRYPVWHIFVTAASAAFFVAIAIAIR